jgi:hypothetical protein
VNPIDVLRCSRAKEKSWWRGKDSNLRRQIAGRFTVCSLWPLGYLSWGLLSLSFVLGADGQTRTGNLLITNQVLYQLSYIGAATIVGSADPPRGSSLNPPCDHSVPAAFRRRYEWPRS